MYRYRIISYSNKKSCKKNEKLEDLDSRSVTQYSNTRNVSRYSIGVSSIWKVEYSNDTYSPNLA